MKKLVLTMILLGLPAFAADKTSDSKPLPQDTQIKVLKAQRQMQQIQIQISSLQRQYEEAIKQLKDLQIQMVEDCGAAAKELSVDQAKYTCDVEALAFVPKADDKKAEDKKAEDKKEDKKVAEKK